MKERNLLSLLRRGIAISKDNTGHIRPTVTVANGYAVCRNTPTITCKMVVIQSDEQSIKTGRDIGQRFNTIINKNKINTFKA